MEEFNQLSANSNHRGSFFYTQALVAGNSSSSNRGRSTTGGSRRTQIVGDCFQPDSVVKAKAFNSTHRDQKLYGPLIGSHQNSIGMIDEGFIDIEAIKARITAHPQYSNLLEAYIDCQKVGAPPEVAASLAEARREFEALQRTASKDYLKDPELDQFMEAYYDMLVKYREEITRPIQEAMDFMHQIESQLNALCSGPIQIFTSDENWQGNGSSEEDQENSGGETELSELDPRAEDRELKKQLLRKYSGGYLTSLKQQLSKKKKKGKLPKEARQKLLNWWELHYKWPYPSEAEKAALAASTGLHQKQINNWFINQRKRHWKPSEDQQIMVIDGVYPPNGGLCIDSQYMSYPHYDAQPRESFGSFQL